MFKPGNIPWNRDMSITAKICQGCEKVFTIQAYKKRQKYCSRECYNSFHSPWNKDKNCPQLSIAFKGRVPWNKGLSKSNDSRVLKFSNKLKGKEKPYLLGDKNPSRRPVVIEKLRELNLGQKNPMYGKKITLEHKQKLVSSSLNKRKDKEFLKDWNKKISLALKGREKSAEYISRLREARLKQIFPKKQTSIENRLQEALKLKGIEFELHKAILGVCQADIFIRPNICVFCDGDWWHANPKFYDGSYIKSPIQKFNLGRDSSQNQILAGNNYIVLRFWEYDINNNLDHCVNIIQSSMRGNDL